MKNPFNRKIHIVSRVIDGEEWFKFNKDFERTRYFHGNLISILLIIVLVTMAVILVITVIPHINLLRTHPCGLCEELGYFCGKAYN